MQKKVKNMYAEMNKAVQTFPYFVLNGEDIYLSSEYKEDIINISKHYDIYNNGATFSPEGSAGDYLPSLIRYKTNKTLIDKQARFMFSNIPDINITAIDETNERDNNIIETYKKIINKIIEKNNFGQKLLKASKDCFIAGRVACLVDMSDRTGIMLHFYSAIEFYYEADYRTGEVIKFISFENVTKSTNNSGKRYCINKYEIVGEYVQVSSVLCDGSGKVVETYVEKHVTDLKNIPVVIIVNDGLLGDKKGVSDLEDSTEYESGYSKMANASFDAAGKGMNPIKYTVDINHETTKKLYTGPGAYWDLEHDQNLEDPKPQVGQIAPSMNHVDAVKSDLERLRAMMYESMDVPDISKEGLLSGITSYKALKALYYPLMTRCNEKLKAWKPALIQIFRFAVELACINASTTKELYAVSDVLQIDYNIQVVENYALIDDETEEKSSDMEEIAVKTRSRFSYLKKWRGEELKTDDAIKEELIRIAKEENMMDTLSMNAQVQSRINDEIEEEETENIIEDVVNEEGI